MNLYFLSGSCKVFLEEINPDFYWNEKKKNIFSSKEKLEVWTIDFFIEVQFIRSAYISVTYVIVIRHCYTR